MKRLLYTLTLVFALGISDNPLMAAEKKAPKTELTGEQKVAFDRIVNRVEEIRNMDKSNLSREDKKALRKELREMKEQARAMQQGVYLSVGAIIIIILLLILIL